MVGGHRIAISRLHSLFYFAYSHSVLTATCSDITSMITEAVIKDIYKSYNKPCKDEAELNLPYFIRLLNPNHQIRVEGDEVVVGNIEEFSPFKRFLKRGLYAVLEFDRNVAFVFQSHILFFNKKEPKMSVHFRPPESKKPSLWERLFGHGDDDDDDFDMDMDMDADDSRKS